MKWIETITPKQAAEELGVPYHGWMREMDRAWISEDQKYSVVSRLLRTEWGKVEHVTITAAEGVGRSDGSGDIPWAVKMEIKNDLFGEKRVAVEVFPTQDRLVDVCDCYHLWVFEKGFQLPFGIHPRDKKTVTVNRGSTRVRAIDGYRQYIGWVKTDGEDCAEEWLKRCVEQALQEELEVNDIQSGSHPPKLYYSSGVNVEDMIRVMSAVSAKMAAERGIKRVPLAVLSQSEISRRMSAI